MEIKQVAPEIGISRGYLSLLERDLKGHRLDHVRGTLERIAAYYGVIPELFLTDRPQEYMAAFIAHLSEVPPTFGARLELVLNELRLRWGEEEFDLDHVAAALGTSSKVLSDYLANRVPVTATVAQQISDITGAPVDWLVPRDAPAPDPTAPFQKAFKMAVESGMEPHELETLIQVWLAAQNKKKPSA